MYPWSLGVLMFLQGLFSMLWVAILMDIASPTLDLRNPPSLSTAQFVLLTAALSTITFAIGVVMHTVSRKLFRERKNLWTLQVLTSPAVIDRFAHFSEYRPAGGPCLTEVQATEGEEQAHKAAEYIDALGYVIMRRAPHVHDWVQLYRDQYRLARGFIIPSVLLGLILPLWAPVPLGHLGNFPLISFQLFFLAVLFAGVSMYAFRERSFRYAAACLRSFLALELEAEREVPVERTLSAVR